MKRQPITIVVSESPLEQKATRALIAMGFNVRTHLSVDPHKVTILEPDKTYSGPQPEPLNEAIWNNTDL